MSAEASIEVGSARKVDQDEASSSETGATEIVGIPRSGSVGQLVGRLGEAGPVTAGRLVTDLLQSHPHYVDKGLEWAETEIGGPTRAIEEHLDVVGQRWDPADLSRLAGRHVVVGLALDPEVGSPLLRSGVIASMLASWRPGLRPGAEHPRPVWDLLSDVGRALAADQPLLAAALGAPPEWSADLPAGATSLAWSPNRDRVAVLAGGEVYEVGPDLGLRRVDAPGGEFLSLGWGDAGIVALTVQNGAAGRTALSTRTATAGPTSVTGGRLSGDGSAAWLEQPSGVQRWSPAGPADPEPVIPAARVLAVDGTGQRGLVDAVSESVLVGPAAEAGPGAPASARTGWPSSVAPLGRGPGRSGPCALVQVGERPAVAAAIGRRVTIDGFPGPTIASITTGQPVTALAADASGTILAVANGHQVAVWTLSEGRAPDGRVPGFDSDRAAGTDFLDADRDARALAALIASAELAPPLAVGLFGEWGSGKSFLLDKIQSGVAALAGTGGYLGTIKVVKFNAWHYAETNLWASLVDKVLTDLGTKVPDGKSPQLVAAEKNLEKATAAEKAADRAVETATDKLSAAERARAKRHRTAVALAAVAGLALVAFVLAVVAFGEVQVLAAVSTGAVLLASSVAAAHRFLEETRSRSEEAAQTARTGRAAVDRLAAGPVERDVVSAQSEVAAEREKQSAAHAERACRQAEVDELARDPLEALLAQGARAELSFVTKTRDYFAQYDGKVTRARAARDAGQPGDVELDRVVIVIDDLDRCAPEKVVTVLEAVHLLFDFAMFVVVLAVDTRWLDQSLRIRYRQLLGRAGTAAPTDYLEKIIQVPVQVPPLDADLVRRMIAGLTGWAIRTPDPEPAAPLRGETPTRASAASSDDLLPAERPRASAAALPPEILKISEREAAALSEVAALVGRTPRTVKRFVNTYRLLKARAAVPARFDDEAAGPVGEHEVVAFLLAVLTGRPAAAGVVLPALAAAPDGATVQTVVAPAPSSDPPTGAVERDLAEIRGWLSEHTRYAYAPARIFARSAKEVARFSFTPPARP